MWSLKFKLKKKTKKKNNGGIGELLITLNKIIRNQGTYFVVIMKIKILKIPSQNNQFTSAPF